MAQSDSRTILYSISVPSFSDQYLDYVIPDIRMTLCQAIPVLTDRGSVMTTIDGRLVPFQREQTANLLTAQIEAGIRFVTNDSLSLHHALLLLAGEDSEAKEAVWRLTDTHSLWDIALLEQRLVWSTEGRAIDIRHLELLCFLQATNLLDSPFFYRGGRKFLYRSAASGSQDHTTVSERYRPTPRSSNRYEELDVAGQVYDLISEPFTFQCFYRAMNYETWNDPYLFQSIGFFGSDSDAARTQFFSNILGMPDSSSLPEWLSQDNFFLRFSNFLFRLFALGHSSKTICKSLIDEFPQIAEHFQDTGQAERWINGYLKRLIASASYDWKYTNYPVFTLLSKFGIVPYFICQGGEHDPEYYPEPGEGIILVDGIERDVSFSANIDDPFHQDAKELTMLRNVIGPSDENHHSGAYSVFWNDYVLGLFREILESRGLSLERGSQEAYELFFQTNGISISGKPGHPVYDLELPSQHVQESADDVRKAVAYALCRSGASLIAVSSDSFLLEVPTNEAADNIDQLMTLAREVTERILDIEPEFYGNFIEVMNVST